MGTSGCRRNAVLRRAARGSKERGGDGECGAHSVITWAARGSKERGELGFGGEVEEDSDSQCSLLYDKGRQEEGDRGRWSFLDCVGSRQMLFNVRGNR